MTDRHPTIGVLAQIDPDEPTGCFDAEVIAVQLAQRIGPTAIVPRTPLPAAHPLRHHVWQAATPAAWAREVDVVVVDDRLDDEERRAAGLVGPVTMIDTTLWSAGSPLASLFRLGVDQAALDARRRMHAHLDLRAADTHLAFGALDHYIFATDGALDTSDPNVAALLDPPPATVDVLVGEFDRLAAAVVDALGDDPPPSRRELVAELDGARRRQAAADEAAADRIDALLAQIARLDEQLEAAASRERLGERPPA